MFSFFRKRKAEKIRCILNEIERLDCDIKRERDYLSKMNKAIGAVRLGTSDAYVRSSDCIFGISLDDELKNSLIVLVDECQFLYNTMDSELRELTQKRVKLRDQLLGYGIVTEEEFKNVQ